MHSTPSQSIAPAATRYRGPIWTLILLAPFIAEVLNGSTRLSFIFAFVPEVMVWGCGALLCREIVRRWRAAGTSLLLLGLAFSVAQEFLIQQTSLAPLPFPGADAAYGRLWGVNWLFFLFLLGFESVFVVLIPVEITELFFPQKRTESWLPTRGLVVTAVVFLVGCRIAWYAWTQRAVPSLHAAPYHPPLTTQGIGCATIGLLIWAAYLLRGLGHAGQLAARRPVSPWIVGLITFVLSAPWWELMTLIFVRHPHPPAWVPIIVGAAWAVLAFAFIRWVTEPAGWSDLHRWSLAFGAVLACTLPGYISTAGWSRLDLAGKIIFQLIGLAGFLLLLRGVLRRQRLPQSARAA